MEKNPTFTSNIFLPVREFEEFTKKFPIGSQQNQENPQTFLRVISGKWDVDFFVCGLKKNGAEFLAYGFSENIHVFPSDCIWESVMNQFYYLNISSLSGENYIRVFERAMPVDKARKIYPSRKKKILGE